MIQTGDVARSGGVVETYTGMYNDMGLAQSWKWPKGTLCITIAANIADSGILTFDACFPDSVFGFVPAREFENARYFEYFVRTAKANLLKFAPATAQKNINLEILSALLIPLPPIEEHQRIVAKVDGLMELCDKLEASLTLGDATRRTLLDALLHDALHPRRNNVIDFEAARRRLLEKRESVACRAVQRLAPTRAFGRVRAVKPLYFAEAHCGIALGGKWGRADFGPFDLWIYSFESRAKGAGWFSVSEHANTDGGMRIEYVPGPALSDKAKAAAQALGDQSAEFERVLALLADLNTEDSEIIATLYAAWNDLLLEGKPISDKIVISEFREHWQSRKATFAPERLRVWLDWMRRNRLVPKGQGPNTRHQAELI